MWGLLLPLLAVRQQRALSAIYRSGVELQAGGSTLFRGNFMIRIICLATNLPDPWIGINIRSTLANKLHEKNGEEIN